MGCIYSKTNKRKELTTIAMIARMRAELSLREASKDESISEEKKESFPASPIFLSQETQQFLTKVNRISKIKLPHETNAILASNPLIIDAIRLLDATFPVSNEIIIILAKHGKYVKKIVEALILLRRHEIYLTEKSITDIAESKFYVDSVADALILLNSVVLLDYKTDKRIKLEDIENIIEGVAKGGFLAKKVVHILLALYASNVPLSKSMISQFSTVDDETKFFEALLILKLNGIKITHQIVTSIANAEYFGIHVARQLVKAKEAGLPLTKENVSLIAKAAASAHIIADALILHLDANQVMRPAFVEPLNANTEDRKRSLSPSL